MLLYNDLNKERMKKKIEEIVKQSGINIEHADAKDAAEQICSLFNVRLSFLQPDSCPDWVEGLGDCNLRDCTFCQIKKEIDANEA